MVDKVLIADDEPDVRNLAKMVLERAGYQIVTASDGIEAEEKAQSELPDAILLDIVMPKKGGFDVCKAIKGQDKTQFIPVIMFSVLERAIDRRMGEEAGANGHFTKPFEPEELVAEVRGQIEVSRTRRFSSALGLQRSELAGRQILMEFSPSVPYERAVRDYILEGKSNGESPVVITNEYSAIHNTLGDEIGIEVIPFKLPLVLSEIFKRHSNERLCFVFDSLSDLILSTMFQSAYNYVRALLPRLSKMESTALFLMNPEAHPPTDVHSMRNIFRDQVAMTDEGLKKIKFS